MKTELNSQTYFKNVDKFSVTLIAFLRYILKKSSMQNPRPVRQTTSSS